jgi:hypothetical protein
MTFRALSLPLLLSLLASCQGKPHDCSTERKGDWALQIRFDLDSSGKCAHSGAFVYDGESHDLKCGVDSDSCLCAGGTEYGAYEVTLTETLTGATSTGVIEVSPAASPECIKREATTRFEYADAVGGAGGAADSDTVDAN